MDFAVLIFLASGLFLGWSLGGNDAANVFGTAVGSRMLRFGTAAVICSVFVILGAVLSGAGAAHTLGKLGSINALAGSFMAALSAASAVYLMTKLGLPVSTTQAIVGGIIGWNLFSQTVTDTATLTTILSTWLICPILAAIFAVLLYLLVTWLLKVTRPHLLRIDAYTRLGLILAGAFGAYSLGANNIANVMGVFVPSSPFTDFNVFGLATFTSTQQLFLLGALAIAVGVITYSKRVMMTVGVGLLPLSPVGAWVAVVAHSLVLFIFASQGLERLLASLNLPTIPLVPVSSSQAVIGAVIGIGVLKGGRTIQWRMLGNIGLGWVATPILAGVICFVGLFFLQNVFNQEVYRAVPYRLSPAGLERLATQGVDTAPLAALAGQRFGSAVAFQEALEAAATLDSATTATVLETARLDQLHIGPAGMRQLDLNWLTPGQYAALKVLEGQSFEYRWTLADALARESEDWRKPADTNGNKVARKLLDDKLNEMYRIFRSDR